jgi:hypothetical protein
MLSRDQYASHVIPYRMKAVAAFNLATRFVAHWNHQPKPLEIYFDGKLSIRGLSTAFTNPTIEAGIIHCRALLEFLGLRCDKKNPARLASKASISVVEQRPSGKKIAGFVVNKNSSADIGLNACLVLEDRIRTKADACAGLPKPIWLAVLNDYWLADADTYTNASSALKVKHCFERIFLVSDQGAVSELSVGA